MAPALTRLVGCQPRLDGGVGDGGAAGVEHLAGAHRQVLASDALLGGEDGRAGEGRHVCQRRLHAAQMLITIFERLARVLATLGNA